MSRGQFHHEVHADAGVNIFIDDGAAAATDPYFANVVSLMHLDGTNGSTTFTDVIPARSWGQVSGAAISTAQSKFGGASLGTTSVASYIQSDTPASDFTFGTGDFTIELWHRTPASLASFWFIFDFRTSDPTAQPCFFYNGGWVYYTNGSARITGSTASTTTWYHIAVCRVSGTTRLFINGTQQGSNYTDSNNYIQSLARLNTNGNIPGTFGANAYTDDWRVTKGVGRYSSNFTAPTAAFPNS